MIGLNTDADMLPITLLVLPELGAGKSAIFGLTSVFEAFWFRNEAISEI